MRSLNGDYARFGLILRILASVLCFLCYLLFPTESFRLRRYLICIVIKSNDA